MPEDATPGNPDVQSASLELLFGMNWGSAPRFPALFTPSQLCHVGPSRFARPPERPQS
jgi:hypothetical protein